MLRAWGIDATAHSPLKLSRDLCAEAGAIFVMGPSLLHRVIWEYGEDLADKAYCSPIRSPDRCLSVVGGTRFPILRSTPDRRVNY